MLKSNGRLAPANKEELASIKGKTMYCPKCDKNFVITKASFGSDYCGVCNSLLEDKGFEKASKATGN